ncbi:MAG: cytochrome c biogenesis protein CcsA [Tannerella sp.]|nr:cytochrome c biogenesis protein CcsA [Tannerella sp.]
MNQLKKFLMSPLTAVVLLSVFAAGLAAATFIESAFGTALAKVAIYYSPLFFFVQLLLVANWLVVAAVHRAWKRKRWGFIVFHFAFIVILCGATVTHFFGLEGVFHLREGEVSDRIMIHTNKGERVHVLPFQIELVGFTLKRYPGSDSPSSYESELLVHAGGKTERALVYMNNTLNVEGYRFFQASFDPDEKGTSLSVNYDVAGRNVTYAGYILLFIGAIMCLFDRHGRIVTLVRILRRLTAAALALVLALPLAAQEYMERYTLSLDFVVHELDIDVDHARRFGALPMRSAGGRIIPINTFASEVLRKLHKKTQIGGLDPDRFLLSLFVMPGEWMHVPFVDCPNVEMQAFLGVKGKYCAYIDAFNLDDSYKLQEKLDAAYRKMPSERNAFDKEVIRMDEKINILHHLLGEQLIRIFPCADDSTGRWYAPGDDLSVFTGKDFDLVGSIFTSYISEVEDAVITGDWTTADEHLKIISTYQRKRGPKDELNYGKIAQELRYNKLAPFRWSKTGYLALGGLMLVLSFVLLFKRRRGVAVAIRVLVFAVAPVFVLHTLGMVMRWNIGGYAPWSNAYETMVYAAWATVLVGMPIVRRNVITFSLATLFAGIILFVSELSWMDPQINPLPPVLKSPWLMFHVAVLMAAYGFFGISCFIGLINLGMMAIIPGKKLPRHSAALGELSIINELSLWFGLILMTLGTFMGAVWANESWGRYWGWDPKETWALITVVVYAIVTHLHLLKKQYSLWLFNLCSVVAFASVLMTYFGVNYFLSGLHSYGENENVGGISVYLYAAALVVALVAVFARKGIALK